MTMEMMTFCFIALAIIFAFVFGFGLMSAPKQPYSYSRNNSLMIPAEQQFLKALDEALKDEFRIFAKVHMTDILRPRKQMGVTTQAAYRSIASQRFDFILCDPKTLKVLLAVELDGKIHRLPGVKVRDDQLNIACQSAELPLVRFDVEPKYSPELIRSKILSHLNSGQSKQVEPQTDEVIRTLA